jgi:hypothetical protein
MRCSTRSAHRAALGVRLAVLFSTVFWYGCGPNDAGSPESFLRALPIPAGWKETQRGEPAVPGTPLAAWSSLSGAWLVAFRTLPDPRPATAKDLAAEWADRHRNLAGYSVRSAGAVEAGGVAIARVDLAYSPVETESAGVEGKSESGGTEMHRTYLGIPARAATYWLLWSYPEEQRTAVEDTIAAFLEAWSPPVTPP